MREQNLPFKAADGFPLTGTLYEPEGAPAVAVLINGATGVPRGFYAAFARHLCTRGYAVLSYDYRGIGDSALDNGDPALLSMRAWGEQDTAAAIDLLGQRFPTSSLTLVGHSVGGQLLGLAENNQRICASHFIASQCGYWRLWPPHLQPMMAANWYLAVPLCLRVLGYLPRQLVGYPLPKGIASEWRRWCTHPEFIVDERGQALRVGFVRYTGALRMLHIADDDRYAPRACVEALAAFYSSANPELRTLHPDDLDLPKIGHFGFFRRSMPVLAWDEVADWLVDASASQVARAA